MLQTAERHSRVTLSCALLRAALVAGILLAAGASRARAQATEPATAAKSASSSEKGPVLTPPRLETPVVLTLPEGVQAPAEGVEVQLTLEVDGTVLEAEPVTTLGEAGDAAVLEAVRALRFSPALRDGVAVRARIRFRFEAQAPEAQGPLAQAAVPEATQAAAAPEAAQAASASQPAVTPSAATEAPPPTEAAEPAADAAQAPAPSYGATARVERSEPGAASRARLRGSELTMVPGTFGEPLRVVATLPGVAHSPYGLGFFVVRGSSFQNTGFFVDGFAVPLLYHLGAGPAIFSSRLVERLDFYAGGYPAAYGNYTAGIVALKTAPPPADSFTLELEVDLLRASGLAIVPFDGGRGSIAVAFRRSYYELILPLVTDDVSLSYADYQLRLDYRFSPKLRASFFLFGSRDALSTAQSTGAGTTTGSAAAGLGYDLDQVIGSLEWKVLPPLSLRWSGTAGRQAIELDSQGTGDPTLSADTHALRLGQRIEATYAPSPRVATTLGVEESVFLYDVKGSVPSIGELPGIPAPELFGETIELREKLLEAAFATYVEPVFRPGRFEITPALRLQYFQYGDVATWLVDPRGVLRYKLTEELKLKAATGLFSQPPLPFYLSRTAGNPSLAPNRAWQNSVGAELALPAAFELDGTVFYNLMWQISRGATVTTLDENDNVERRFFDDDGEGRAYGLELMVRKRAERGLFGWVSYTLSRSERFLPGGRTMVFNFDQTHVLNIATSYATSNGWTFGARFALASGRPTSDLLDPEGNDALYDADADEYEADSRGRRTRLPMYHQLDVRIDRAFRLGFLEGSVYLDVINVYNAQNSEGYQYQYDFTKRGRLPGLPLLPTIGIRGVMR